MRSRAMLVIIALVLLQSAVITQTIPKGEFALTEPVGIYENLAATHNLLESFTMWKNSIPELQIPADKAKKIQSVLTDFEWKKKKTMVIDKFVKFGHLQSGTYIPIIIDDMIDTIDPNNPKQKLTNPALSAFFVRNVDRCHRRGSYHKFLPVKYSEPEAGTSGAHAEVKITYFGMYCRNARTEGITFLSYRSYRKYAFNSRLRDLNNLTDKDIVDFITAELVNGITDAFYVPKKNN